MDEEITHTDMQKKVKAKLLLRDIAPRDQTENTTRDFRSYRVELFLFTCISEHESYDII